MIPPCPSWCLVSDTEHRRELNEDCYEGDIIHEGLHTEVLRPVYFSVQGSHLQPVNSGHAEERKVRFMDEYLSAADARLLADQLKSIVIPALRAAANAISEAPRGTPFT